MIKNNEPLMFSKDELNEIKPELHNLISWQMTDRQICDIELILNRGFYPLTGFLNQADYNSVLQKMRLINGDLWPIPVNLDVSSEFSKKLKIGQKISLRDKEGFNIAILDIENIWEPNLEKEALSVYGTKSIEHPAVEYLLNFSNKIYLGGKIKGIEYPHHYDYKSYRHSPVELKAIFKKNKWEKIIAFQTRNPLHRAHVEMTQQAIKSIKGNLLLHPAVGMTKPGDVDHYTRVRCYEHVIKKYPMKTAILSLLPLAMRMGGPREALWHALIRKNYGCTHMIVGRDHAGPGKYSNGKNFYDPYEAQNLLTKHQNEIGIKMIPFSFMVYLTKEKRYEALSKIKNGVDYRTISGTELRSLLDEGKDIPEWFSYREVGIELQKSRPPLIRRGLTIFFTGLSGSGKSTLANGLLIKFLEDGDRPVTLLDGDLVRTHLSSELGFSREHRSLNVQRIGYVASEITKNGGVAICAPIAPYELDRKKNRNLIQKTGGYIEIFVNTPIEKCEERDVKGLYQLARKGIIKEFTGISDPYETPSKPEIIINSSLVSPEKLVDKIYIKIKKLGYVK